MYVHTNHFKMAIIKYFKTVLIFGFILNLYSFQAQEKQDHYFFKIRVIDAETKKGVPMVGLVPLTQERYYSDSNGLIAFNEPGLMGKDVYFEVMSEGYEYPQNLEDKRAVTLFTKPGDSAVVEIRRTSVAERLYRSTGLGIYRDSELLGESSPIDHPIINADVIGQDSNLTAIYKGQIFWIWGDTFLPPTYKGSFSVNAATSLLPTKGGLDPNIGVNYNYFQDEKGQSRAMINLKSPGYVWFDWIMNFKDKNGKEQLVAKYANVNYYFGNYERGIAVFNDDTQIFDAYKSIPDWLPEGHTCHHPFIGIHDGKALMHLTTNFSYLRVQPKLESVSNPKTYEAFTCLKQGTTFDTDSPQLDRNKDGKLIYAWKQDTDPVNYDQQEQLIKAGHIQPEEAWIQLTDINTGTRLPNVGRGSVYWNNYRQKWILITGAMDTWYSEADTPIGPWVFARKVAEHQSFLYNPTQQPIFDQNNGEDIFFEGTFTKFVSTAERVPRYDYNQITYKLTLSNEDVFLPEAVYQTNKGYSLLKDINDKNSVIDIGFYAMPKDRKVKGMIPIYQSKKGKLLTKGSSSVFYGFPSEIDTNLKFLGTWEVQIIFASFENSFNIELKKENENLVVISNKEKFKITNAKVENDKLYLTLIHPEGTYELEAKVLNGIMNGTWTRNGLNGTWTANDLTEKWWGQFTNSLVDLFEFKNSTNTKFYYSTAIIPKSGYVKSDVSICRVWKNPSSQFLVDFKTKIDKNY
jgi:hypothetical protein